LSESDGVAKGESGESKDGELTCVERCALELRRTVVRMRLTKWIRKLIAETRRCILKWTNS